MKTKDKFNTYITIEFNNMLIRVDKSDVNIIKSFNEIDGKIAIDNIEIKIDEDAECLNKL